MYNIILGCPKCPFSFFHKKDTFFIFTNNFIALDILSMSSISQVVQCWLFLMSQFDRYQLQLYQTMGHRPARNLQHETSQTTFVTFDQSQCLLHTLHRSFILHSSCVFTFLEILKHNTMKMFHFSSILNIKMAAQKFTNFDKFLKNVCWYDSCHNNIQQNCFKWN